MERSFVIMIKAIEIIPCLFHSLHGWKLRVIHIQKVGVVDAVGGGVGGIGQGLADDIFAGRQSGAELLEKILAGTDGRVGILWSEFVVRKKRSRELL